VQVCVNEWSLSLLPNPIPELQHAPLPFCSATSQGVASTPCSSVVFSLGLTFESFKELGVRQGAPCVRHMEAQDNQWLPLVDPRHVKAWNLKRWKHDEAHANASQLIWYLCVVSHMPRCLTLYTANNSKTFLRFWMTPSQSRLDSGTTYAIAYIIELYTTCMLHEPLKSAIHSEA
jgi:hypothetical protein